MPEYTGGSPIWNNKSNDDKPILGTGGWGMLFDNERATEPIEVGNGYIPPKPPDPREEVDEDAWFVPSIDAAEPYLSEWGTTVIELPREAIERFLRGDVLLIDDGEYTTLVYLKRDE